MNTRFQRASVTVAGRDGHPQEFDRPTGAEVASEERLVAGSFGHKTSVARLEHKPGFLASLESQRRRVPDCEMLYLARVLGVRLDDLFPKNLPLNKIGSQFQSAGKLAIFPTRAEK